MMKWIAAASAAALAVLAWLPMSGHPARAQSAPAPLYISAVDLEINPLILNRSGVRAVDLRGEIHPDSSTPSLQSPNSQLQAQQ